MRAVPTLLLILGMVWGISPASAAASVFPDTAWIEKSPESQGVDSLKLQEALQYLESSSGSDGVREVVIVRNGYLIWKGNNIDRRHHVWSISKVFTSTLFGLLSDDGLWTPETPAQNIEPALSENYPDVRMKHFASMTSGYDAAGGASWGDGLDGSSTPWVPTAPMFAPGEAFLYWDDAANMMGYLITRAGKESMQDQFRRRIADPIGMDPAAWRWQNLGIVDGILLNYGARGVEITAEELARVGLLYLNGGAWKESRLLSDNYVTEATRNHVPPSIPLFRDINPDPGNYTDHMDIDGRGRYGFHWWANDIKPDGTINLPDAPPKTYYRTGYNHNHMVVVPEWDMVIVRLGTDGTPADRDGVWNGFLKKVGEALVSPAGVVSAFTLVDADTDEPIRPLADGDVLNLALLPTSRLNILAETVPESVGSLRFDLDGAFGYSLDNASPYSLAGDSGGDFNPWTPGIGSHTLTATPFSEPDAGGTAGTSLGISFEVVDEPAGFPPTANAGADQSLIDIDGDGVETVTLDASGSSDDGTIVSYEWFRESVLLASGIAPQIELPVGSHVITLTVTDDSGLSASDEVLVKIAPAPTTNAPPIAADDSVATAPGEPVTIVVLGNDSDPDGTLVPSTVAVDSAPGHGTASVDAASGAIVYAPDSTFSGTDSFTYTVEDNEGAISNAATVTVSVENASLSVVRLVLVDADSDADIGPIADGETLDISALPTRNLNIRAETSPADVGSVRFALDGEADFSTENAAPYALAGDNSGDYNPWTPGPGSHSVTATPFSDTNANGTAGAPLSVVFYVVENPVELAPVADAGPDQRLTDVDGDGLESVQLDGSGSSDDGTIISYEWFRESVLAASGISPLVELPIGEHSLVLTVTDDSGLSGSDTVSVIIDPFSTENLPPVASDDSAATAAGEPVAIAVLANDGDPDGSLVPSTVAVVSEPSHGLASVDADSGEIVYTPENAFVGTDAFTYTVEDDAGALSNAATVTVTVRDSLAVVRLVLVNADTDADIGPMADGVTLDLSSLPTRNLNIRAETLPAVVGSVRFALDGEVNFRTENSAPYSLAGDGNGNYRSWTPLPGSHALTATPFSESSAKGAVGAPVSIAFTVVDELNNLPPVAVDDSAMTAADEAVTIAVLLNDDDPDGTLVPSTVLVASAPLRGQAVVDKASGLITYIPESGFSGADAFTYTVEDDDGALSNPATVAISVQTASFAVVRLVLVNADTDSDIGPLADGDTLDLAALPTRNLNIRAETEPPLVGSVRFALDDATDFRTENAAPYALAGDGNGNYHSWTPQAGTHGLTAIPYEERGAKGRVGVPLGLTFQVVEGQ